MRGMASLPAAALVAGLAAPPAGSAEPTLPRPVPVTGHYLRQVHENLPGNIFHQTQNGFELLTLQTSGRDIYYSQHMQAGGVSMCIIQYVNRGVFVEYHDQRCDDVLDTVQRGSGAAPQPAIAWADHREYGAALGDIVDVAKVTRRFRQDLPTPRPALFPDPVLARKNSAKLRYVATAVLGDPQPMRTKDGRYLVFYASNGRQNDVWFAFETDTYGEPTNCFLRESDDPDLFDNDCDGVVDGFQRPGTNEIRPANPGNVVVYNASLVDLAELARLAFNGPRASLPPD